MTLSDSRQSRRGQISAPHAAFALRLRARPSVSVTFEATFAFTVVTARWLVISPRKTLSIGFRVSVSLHHAIQTTGLLTLAPAGLSPAEHASLRWTHNRTCRSPASGSPTGFTVRHTASTRTARGFNTVSHSPSPLDTAVSDGACL